MSWTEGALGDFLTLKRGHDLPNGSRKAGDVPVVSSSGFTGWHNEAKAQPPGVVTGRYGTIGEVFYLDQPYWPLNTALYVIDFKGNDPRFVAYFLRHKLKNYKSEKAAVPGVDRNVLHKMPASCPDTQTQQSIVRILSAYDDLIENNRRRIVLLEAGARQLYKEWFVRLRFPGHEHTKITDGVPEGWERAPASDVLNVLSGGTPKTTTPQFWDGEIGFFTPKDAVQSAYVSTTEKKITEAGLAKCNSKLYPKDTLFITARGTVGNINLALEPMAMNQSCYALISKSCLSQRMLYLTMDASLEQFRSQASGAVFDAIVVATFDRISVVKPDKQIATAFDVLIDPIFDQIANLGKQNQQLAKARDLLLPRLMNGSLAV